MKKLGIALLVLVMLVGVAAAAVPWYVGMETERHVRTQIKDPGGNGSAFALTLVQYERGWMRSTAVHRISLKADPQVYFEIHHDLRHLSDPRTGLVVVESTPRWPEKVQAAADYYFGKQPAVTLTTVVDFERNLDMRLKSPAFSKPLLTEPQTTLSWGGATGQLTVGGAAKMKLDMKVPSVRIEGQGAKAVAGGIAMQGDWTIAGSQLDWQGTTRFAVSEVSFQGPTGAGSLKGLESTVVQRNQGQTVMLGYALKVREGTASGADLEQHGFTDAVLDLEFDRLDKAALNKYVDDLRGAQEAGVSAQAQTRLVAQLWLTLMSDLLKGSPEVRVKQLGMKTAQGTISGSAVLGFDGADLSQPVNPLELLTRAKFNGSAELSASLLRAWMTKSARAQATNALLQQGVAADKAQLQMFSDQLVQQQLDALQAVGVLRAEGDKFVVRAELAQGKLMLNGMPGDQLLGGLLAPTPVLAPAPAPAVGPARAPGERDA